MKSVLYYFYLLLLIVVTVTNGFQITPRNTIKFSRFRRITLRSVEQEPSIQLLNENNNEAIPIDLQNIQNAAALASGLLGYVYCGPVTALTLAGASKFAAKQNGENDLGHAVRGVGRTVLEAYNFLHRVNNKYGITNTISDSFELTVDAIAEEAPVVDKIKKSYVSAIEKLDKVNREYGILEKGTQAFVGAADLSETAIEKTFELNEKFNLMGRLESLVNRAIMTLRPDSFPPISKVDTSTDTKETHSDSSDEPAATKEKEEAMKYFKDIFKGQDHSDSNHPEPHTDAIHSSDNNSNTP